MKGWYSAGLLLLLACAAAWGPACSRERREQPAPPQTPETQAAPAAMAPDEALIYYAAHGNAGGVAQALHDGADIEVRDANGLTPLMWAAQQKVASVVSLLLERGANPYVRDNAGWTPLHCAASGGSAESLENLLASCGDSLEALNNEAETPLLVAVRMHREDIARMLVDAGADINASNRDGLNAMDVARAEKMHSLVQELRRLGALPQVNVLLLDMARDGRTGSMATLLAEHPDLDLEVHNESGWTPLMFAAASGHTDSMRLLLDAGAKVSARDRVGMTPLLYAALEGHQPAVQQLLERGASLQEHSVHGWNTLLLAASHRHTRLVQYLLQLGVDVNGANADGETPLIVAAANGHSVLAVLLLNHGATVDATDAYGWSALMVAAAYGQKGVADILLDSGADLERQDANGWSPALCAASAGSVETLRHLVAHGANLAHRDAENRSALAIASGMGHLDTVRYLVEECGMQLNEVDSHGWTPLMHAAALGRDQVVEFLLRHGADASVENKQGETAYHLATMRGEKVVLKIMEDCGVVR